MPVVILNGPMSYRYKGKVHLQGIPSPELPIAEAAYLVGTGRFKYVGTKDPAQVADDANKKRRTRTVSELTRAGDIEAKETPKEKGKNKVVLTKKQKKTADVQGGLPVFDTVQELADYAFEKHGIVVSEDTYDGTVQQIQDEFAASREGGVTV